MSKQVSFDPVFQRSIIVRSQRKLLGSIILQWEIDPFILLPENLLTNVPPFFITPEDVCQMKVFRNDQEFGLELKPVNTKNLMYCSFKFTGSSGIILHRKSFIINRDAVKSSLDRSYTLNLRDEHLIGKVNCECVIKAYENLHQSYVVSVPELKEPDSQLSVAKNVFNVKNNSSGMTKSCQSAYSAESLQALLGNLKNLSNSFFPQKQYHLSSTLKKLSEELLHMSTSLPFEEQQEIINKSDTLKKLNSLLKDLCIYCETKEQYEKFFQSGAHDKLLSNLMQLCNLLEDDEQYIAVRESIAENKLNFDLKRAYEHGLHTDINLKVGEAIIAAHKVILCCRSPVLSAMFKHDTSEKAKNVIEITDVEFSVLQRFVAFLYSSELDVDDFDTLCGLYYAADKYGVSDLRLKCREMMVTKLNIDNACRTLALGNHHNDAFLKNKTIEFITIHLKDVAQTNGWVEFMNSKLSSEVLRTIK